MRSKVEGISLGQGQGVLAARLIEEALVKGSWILLQVCLRVLACATCMSFISVCRASANPRVAHLWMCVHRVLLSDCGTERLPCERSHGAVIRVLNLNVL